MCISFHQLLPEPSGQQQRHFICRVLYLRHLREQADGQRQGEAKGNEAHKAVHGQQQSAAALQEAQPSEVEIVIKESMSTLCGSIQTTTAEPGFNFRSEDKHCRFQEAILHNWWVGDSSVCVKVLVLALMSHSDHRSLLFK